MIDDPDDSPPAPRRPTRAEQRTATRTALIDATIDCLTEDGYAALTTRVVADRAGVAQSTLMHHFVSREALLVEAVTQVAMRMADEALDAIDLAAMREPDHREAVLDQTWRTFTAPRALAAAQLWAAAWAEPELAAALRESEERLSAILHSTASMLFPDVADDPRFGALIDTAVSLLRGMVLALPISGRAALDARWEATKPILIDAADRLLDTPRR